MQEKAPEHPARDPIYIPKRLKEALDQPRSAYAAFQLLGLAPLSPKSRISRQALFVARCSKLATARMGGDCAFELRYIVTPANERNAWQSSINAYLLMRLSQWNVSLTNPAPPCATACRRGRASARDNITGISFCPNHRARKRETDSRTLPDSRYV